MAGDPGTQEIVRELTRQVITRAAPEELPLVQPMSDQFFEGRRRRGASGREDPLGFGLDTAVVLLTPIVLQVTAALVDELAQQLAGAVATRGLAGLRLLRRLVLRQEDAAELAVPALSPGQLDRVHGLARDKAVQLGLDPQQAELLADALRGSLTITPD
ncbi:hypothetical protein GCM10009850_118870 [Nonomuraea monospora]|uniref:Uncharacterized protein n=1 Tax=Nonomuraea monospora TaxID=568818 RepID=A0ABN3D3J9_9ACTN